MGISFGTIKNCSSNIIVTGEGMVGGMVGTNDGTVINSFVKGDVSGTGQVGGMAG